MPSEQGFAQYAPPVFARCTRLIDMALNKQRAGLEEGTENDLIVPPLAISFNKTMSFDLIDKTN